ncbi:MAG TPA: SWIM zinc finger family protein [Accumulibacter sp.]|uniref:SWIM zinc finger family protein n=1 Tax=Accumulibacter sp. TaxID=2053492 RepID=UPI002CC5C1D2|nr:SWIM zinc finger family protein [Accumulibacter sp.]HMW55639.1 SWIM zinc finger family protein [Accumulibacter sp.]
MTVIGAEAVLALAPDASSATAARALVMPARWPVLGANDVAVWGACQGSGSKPYQTQVDITGATPVFRCSCPSRKFPCKHALALLLLRARQEELFTQTDAPAWVSEWLSTRAGKERKKEEKQRAEATTPVDPEIAGQRDLKRQAQRWSRIEGAATELQAWLYDQIGRGLGAIGDEQLGGWHTMAARMVDAQAAGLASRVREAAHGIRRGTDWPERLLHRLGLLYLLCAAIRRRADLSPEMQAELRTIAGWPYDKSEVLSTGKRLADQWTVLGQIREENEDHLTELRVWLHGRNSGRRALLLEHAFAGKGFEQSWLNGSTVEATLAYFPGTSMLRALVAEVTASVQTRWPDSTSSAEWRTVAERVASSPWVRLHPMVLPAAVPLRAGDQTFLMVEGQTVALHLGDADTWRLLAYSGGHPLVMMGEWDGLALRPLSAWGIDGLWQRSPE